jgi:hypothetical protein
MICDHSSAVAQNRLWLEIKGKPLIKFDGNRASTSTYPKAKLSRIVEVAQKRGGVVERAPDRAFADVSRPVINLLADSVGIQLPPESEWTPELLDKLYEATTPETRKEAAVKWNADPRDTSTPDAMAALLVRVHRKDLLKRESAELLLDGLLRNQDGDTRLKGMLPPRVPVLSGSI